MAIPVQNTALTNTVDFLINRVNELANNMTLWTVTTDGNTSYTVPTGNSAVNGSFAAAGQISVGNTTVNVQVFGANSAIVANSVNTVKLTTNNAVVNTAVSIGNTTVNTVINSTAFFTGNSTANIVLNSPTATQISNGQYYHNANGGWSFLQGSTYQTNTAGVTLQLIDSWLLASFRTADYIVHVEDLNNNNHTSTRLFTTHDNTNGYVTEYATLATNSAIGVFSVSTNTTAFLLNFTPNTGFNNTSIRYIRTLLT